MPGDRILIFAKRPMPGRVKTRLTPALSEADAAAVYEACLEDVVALAQAAGAPVELWFAGVHEDAHDYFAAKFPELTLRAQVQGGLGARLADAFARSFADDAERVVVLGSDSPTLPGAVIGSALDVLAEADAALGPTRDGGYYLVSIRRRSWPRAMALFEGIPWSTAAVLTETLARAAAAKLEVTLMPAWYDIDEVGDLRRARADLDAGSRLGAWLERNDPTA